MVVSSSCDLAGHCPFFNVDPLVVSGRTDNVVVDLAATLSCPCHLGAGEGDVSSASRSCHNI